MNDVQLVTLVAETDAYAPHSPLPAATWSHEAALLEIERRMGMDTRDTNEKETPPGVTPQIKPTASPKTTEGLTKETGKRRWSGALVAAAAFAVVVIVGLAILLASGGGDDVAPATPVTTQAPPTTQAAPTTQAPSQITVDEALAVSDAYFAAYEAGDVDAMLALFTSDLDLSMPGGGSSLEEWEKLYTWKLAEGTVLTPSECVTTVEDTGITVVCEYAHHQYPAILVGAPATAHTLTMTVTPNGSISGLRDSFQQPGFVTDGPFELWVRRNHPVGEGDKVRCCGWASVEDARAAGLIRAQYAEEWAAYLEANGCAFGPVVGFEGNYTVHC